MRRGLGGCFVPERACFYLGENCLVSLRDLRELGAIYDTSQSINGPLLELLESNLCCWWGFVQVQTMGVLLLLVEWSSELLLLVINSAPPLWIEAAEVLSDHFRHSLMAERQIIKLNDPIS